jgi:hypothetical protein
MWRLPVRALALMSAVLAFPSATRADHAEPAKANKVSFSLVNGFFECSSPNTAMQSNGKLACAPPTPNNPCAFGPDGAGTLSFAKVGNVSDSTEDFKIIAVAKGLNAACEGQQLHVRLLYRLTNDDCPEGSCTAVDDALGFDLIAAPCIVTDGKCKIKTTLNTAAPGTIPNGKNSGIEVFACGLKSPLFFGFDPDLRCGVLLK